MTKFRLFPFMILVFLDLQILLTAHEDPSYKDIQVGVILDMESWVGKDIYGCITMAISDFYVANPHYRTRIVFKTRDTKGEPLHALSAALDLLENTEVQAIIGPVSTVEARFLEVLESKANIPILSFSKSPFPNQSPYLLRIAPDEATQFKGIAAMVQSFKAKNVIVICEDTANGRQIATYMVSEFQEKSVHITYTCLISTSATHEQIREELRKLQTIPAMVFVMHTPPSLSSQIFSGAQKLGMMGAGYMWIVTSKTTDCLDFIDAKSIESMQGAVGFKSYFPESRKLHNGEWKKEHINGIWAYDAVYALAMAVEMQQTTELASKELVTISSTPFLNQILKVNFYGLGGEFKLINGRTISKAMEVVNVISKGGRRVGFWMATTGEFVNEIGQLNSSSNHGLESINLLRRTTTFQKRGMLQTNGKKLKILVPDFGTFPNLLQLTVDPRTNLSAVSGFCGDVFIAAFNALDYVVGVEIIPLPYNTGMAYNDLIDKISLKEYDAGVGDISITANRSVYVDFTLLFTDMGIGTIAHNSNKSMWIFLNPLSADLWITSACFFLFLGFVIWFNEHCTNNAFQGSTPQQIGTTLWFAFSTLVYAHGEKLHSNLSRFVVTVWVFAVLVLTSSYTATLSSLLTVQQIGMKETSIGFLGVWFRGGAVFNNLNFAGANIRKLYTPEAYAKALTSGSVDAIIDEILYVKTVLALYPDSDFSLISTASTTNGFGFAFQKGSPLAGEMSTEIAKMREDGTLKASEDKWLKRQSALMSKDFSSPTIQILNLYGFRGLFLISGVSMALANLVSLVRLGHEKLHVKVKMQIWRLHL